MSRLGLHFSLVFALAGSVVLAVGARAGACQNASINLCFRPGSMSCADQIVAAVNLADKSIDIMAYSFTSAPIAQAVANARRRGLLVRAVLDKTNRREKYSAADFVAHAGIPTRIDNRVTISHNKVIIIDSELVVTGSYNFTKAAEEKNAENVLFIRDRCVAAYYVENFEDRWRLASPYNAR